MSLQKGVFLATKKDGTKYYRSSFTYKSRHISLGSFDSEAKAHKAYLQASAIMSNSKITIENYQKYTSTLSFEKAITLLNLRDHGMYFKTPIYMFPKYFEYYLSADLCLTFDVDDLFYYSTHKIMRRGGHYFVSDYGMQVNILGRYGIKNFAVPGKDYLFKNQNPYDFRRANIEIINRYNGVSRIEEPGKTIYLAKIHIHGDFIIGRYSDEIDAAIAYNKAIDLLAEKGIHKDFTQNYIDGLSSMEYARRYYAVPISDKIRNY